MSKAEKQKFNRWVYNNTRAMAALEECAIKLKNTAFQIAIGVDPCNDTFIVTLDSAQDKDDEVCVTSCVTAKTLSVAISRFEKIAKKLLP